MSLDANKQPLTEAGVPFSVDLQQLVEAGPLSMAQEDTGVLVFLLFVLFVGFVIMGVGAKRFQTGRLVKNTAPEKVRSVAIGRTELRGNARDAGVVFDQPFTEGKCLYYSYAVKQLVEREVTNDEGERETERDWETISSHSLAAPFYLDDGTGEILVVANAGADFVISDDNKFSKSFRGGISSSYKRSIDTSVDIADAIEEGVEWEPHNLAAKIDAKLPLISLPGTASDVKPRNSGSPKKPKFRSNPGDGKVVKKKITQTVLPVDSDVYVFGGARERTDPMGSNEQRLIIQGDDDTGRFIVSDRDEDKLARRYTLVGLGILALGLAVSAGSVGILANGLLA